MVSVVSVVSVVKVGRKGRKGRKGSKGGRFSRVGIVVWPGASPAWPTSGLRPQGERTISSELSLLSLLFALRGMGWEEYATLIPNAKGEDGVPSHFLLRFALS